MAWIDSARSRSASLATCRRPVSFRRHPGAHPMIDLPTASVSPCRISRNLVIRFLPLAFELDRALFGSVLREHPRPRRMADGQPPVVGYIAQIAQRLLRSGVYQHLPADLEDAVEPLPPVADHRRGARARFEQP